jgi:hypothetical protein
MACSLDVSFAAGNFITAWHLKWLRHGQQQCSITDISIQTMIDPPAQLQKGVNHVPEHMSAMSSG